jgi:peptidoglycan/LPS O-acetylase OafA/YrhL
VGGASFLFAHTSGTQNVGNESHIALAVVCFAFAAGIGLATYGLQRESELAQTPFVLIQVFVAIGAYLGISSTEMSPRILGGLALAVALVAVVAAVRARRGIRGAS